MWSAAEASKRDGSSATRWADTGRRQRDTATGSVEHGTRWPQSASEVAPTSIQLAEGLRGLQAGSRDETAWQYVYWVSIT